MPNTEPKRYLALAAEKRKAAENATDDRLKKEFIELAIAYEKLAEQTQRILTLTERPPAPRR